jgi:16S rRNA (guanine1207-N2)-methyltransferase
MATQTTSAPPLLRADDRLLMDEAASLLEGTVVVLDAPEVALRLMNRDGGIRVGLDSAEEASRIGSRETARSVEEGLAAADIVLLRLPTSLDRLDDTARLIARHAKPTVTLLAGGRLKYMTLAMNEVLGRSFNNVHASLARQKSRVLYASGPRDVAAPEPHRSRIDDLDLEVVAWGGVFAGASLDIGTRAMLSTFDRLPDFATAIDFGCGTGILAAQLKRARPTARVIASDDSDIAARSAQQTMAANGLDVEVVHEAWLREQPDESVDLIVLNPPFHDGGAVSTDRAHRMLSVSARKLKPGGELRTVWNSHLGYRAPLSRYVGPTTELTRTPKFTVTASIKSTN